MFSFISFLGKRDRKSEVVEEEVDESEGYESASDEIMETEVKPAVAVVKEEVVTSEQQNVTNPVINTDIGYQPLVPSTPSKGRERSTPLSKYKSPGYVGDLNYKTPLENEERKKTLAHKLAKIVPDAEIKSPNVIIVGGQTAGKTKLIISLVFHHLIDNQYFTDEMGEQLLKIFRTGTKMVTKRPTTVQFSKNDNGCSIKLVLGKEVAEFSEPKFSEIINLIHLQSRDSAGLAYGEELKVFISAPGLHTMSFTDLPGLITQDKQLHDNTDSSVRRMVRDYMSRSNTTVVVVEPASIEDFETSQVTPLLRDIKKNERENIFENSVLVLSKCDKIRQGLEPQIMDIINLTSSQLMEFPYKHVVGVANKREPSFDEDIDPIFIERDDMSFVEFKEHFKATKAYEHMIFSSFLNKDLSPCCDKTQYSTSAVFHMMDQISFDMVHESIGKGIYSIEQKLNEIEDKIREQLAPPLSFYDSWLDYIDSDVTTPNNNNNNNNAMVVDDNDTARDKQRLQESMTEDDINRLYNDKEQLQQRQREQDLKRRREGRTVILDEFKVNFERLLSELFNTTHVFSPTTDEKAKYLHSLGSWPSNPRYDVVNMSKQRQILSAIVSHVYDKFLDRVKKRTLSLLKPKNDLGCFSKVSSPFHRVDRFPRFADEIRNYVATALNNITKTIRQRLNAYVGQIWEYQLPKGYSEQQVSELIEELRFIVIREIYTELHKEIYENNRLQYIIQDDDYYLETVQFIEKRQQLEGKPPQLYRQREILQQCLRVKSNDELRQIVEELDKKVISQELTEEYWIDFWRLAEVKRKIYEEELRRKMEIEKENHSNNNNNNNNNNGNISDDIWQQAGKFVDQEFDKMSNSQSSSPMKLDNNNHNRNNNNNNHMYNYDNNGILYSQKSIESVNSTQSNSLFAAFDAPMPVKANVGFNNNTPNTNPSKKTKYNGDNDYNHGSTLFGNKAMNNMKNVVSSSISSFFGTPSSSNNNNNSRFNTSQVYNDYLFGTGNNTYNNNSNSNSALKYFGGNDNSVDLTQDE